MLPPAEKQFMGHTAKALVTVALTSRFWAFVLAHVRLATGLKR